MNQPTFPRFPDPVLIPIPAGSSAFTPSPPPIPGGAVLQRPGTSSTARPPIFPGGAAGPSPGSREAEEQRRQAEQGTPAGTIPPVQPTAPNPENKLRQVGLVLLLTSPAW